MEKPDANVHHFKYNELLQALGLALGVDGCFWSVSPDGIFCQQLDSDCLVQYVAGKMLYPSVRAAVIQTAVLENLEEKHGESAG